MITAMHKLFVGACIFAMLAPFAASAQQLRITAGSETHLDDPTTYRAYYGKLDGEPHIYTFSTEADTPVKFVLLVPDVPDAKTDISATLIDAAHPESLFLTADGALVEWQRFFDTAGRDSYLAGPTIDATIPAGTYRIQVSSSADDAQYVLIVSGEESFSIVETLRRFATLPEIKSAFFGKSGAEAYLTPLLLWPVFGILIVLGLIVFAFIVYRRRTASPFV